MRLVSRPVASILAVIAGGGGASCAPGESCVTRATPREGGDPVRAARAFLDSLGYEKLDRASRDFDDEGKARWSNLPDGVLAGRNGLRTGDMTDAQCEAAAELLFAAVPEVSSRQLLDVMRADDFLAAHNQPNPIRWSSDNYYWAVFGEPSDTVPWMFQMNGHHSAVNVTFVDGQVTRAPDFLGVEPIEFPADGALRAPMDDERRVGLDAANALIDTAEARVAHPADGILLGAGQDGKFPETPEGEALGAMNDAQRALVRDIVVTYLRRVPEPSRTQWLADFDAALDDARFAWAGDLTDASLDAYYRVQAPSIWIELSFEGAIGNDGDDSDAPKPHYHSVLRDPRNDYGAAWTKGDA